MADPRHVHVCPLCGGRAERVHRHFADRLLGVFRSVHRYSCTRPDCSWEGIVSKEAHASARGPAQPAGWRSRALWFFVGAAVALSAAQGARLWVKRQAAQQASAAAAAKRASLPPMPVPEGESYDGEELSGDDPRAQHNESPLTLARGCAWGIPGRSPYQGTVAQALVAARVPESAVRKLEALVENRQVSDQLLISRDGITTVSGRRKFDEKAFDMAFGRTLCFGTRVNFRGNHTETADLYEATDADGNRYAIMIPIVCGNVSVLGERGERNGGYTNGSTPVPGTLALIAIGLAAALAARRLRKRG